MTWLRARKERRLLALDELRQARKLVDEDITVFGEQLSDLHLEMLTTELDRELRLDYQRALELYDEAKAAMQAAQDTDSVVAVDELLDDGRWRLARVLARRDGVEPPARREPCFFNPQHGPAVEDLTWAPPGGTDREIGVCRSGARRITGGDEPEIRLVRVGDRYVPWYAAERERGMLTAAVGTHAVEGVPRYMMLEADLRRAAANNPGLGNGGFPS
jgi:hypothetical protein